MATFRQFEDILAWQKARELVARLYQVSRAGEFSRDFALREQMRRASLSIPSNIAEGFERGGRKEFILFLGHAKGSCGEVRSQLYHALDLAYSDEPTWGTPRRLPRNQPIAGWADAIPPTNREPRPQIHPCRRPTLNLKP